MLTILAYIVFVPALLWNVVLCSALFYMVFTEKGYHWANFRNLRDIILSLVVLFVPGVYLWNVKFTFIGW
jgi:hypothetical protein